MFWYKKNQMPVDITWHDLLDTAFIHTKFGALHLVTYNQNSFATVL